MFKNLLLEDAEDNWSSGGHEDGDIQVSISDFNSPNPKFSCGQPYKDFISHHAKQSKLPEEILNKNLKKLYLYLKQWKEVLVYNEQVLDCAESLVNKTPE